MMAPAKSRLDSASSYCEQVVREQDPDRYWAALFAPIDKRSHLLALYAFNAEIAQVRESISAPLPGEIRLQWWRDVLDGIAGQAIADDASHPVAEALAACIRKFKLPVQAFHDLIDAHVFDLYDDAMPSLSDLEGYCGETCSVIFRLASIILYEGEDPGGADAAGHAGVAYALTGLLRNLPWHIRHGQMFIPADILQKANLDRELLLAASTDDKQIFAIVSDICAIALNHYSLAQKYLPAVKIEARPAFLPLAFVPAYIAQIKQRDYSPRRSLITLPQWRRLWVLWRASRRWSRI